MGISTYLRIWLRLGGLHRAGSEQKLGAKAGKEDTATVLRGKTYGMWT